MAKTYKGSLTLEWYNKQKAIMIAEEQQLTGSEIPAPRINWVNKEEALFYEIDENEGKGLRPYWVDRSDIRVKEARPLLHQKTYRTVPKDTPGTIPGTSTFLEVEESNEDAADVQNILIKGDNLLALNTLKKMFDNKPDEEKVKCIFIDPPYNTGYAFEQYDDNLAHSEWLSLMRDRLVLLREVLQENGSIWISIDDDESHYLKVLCDDIFGRQNFVANVVWKKKFSPQNDAKWFSDMHDHILVYAKSKEIWRPNLMPRTAEMDDRYSNPDNDTRGSWTPSDMTVKSYSEEYDYEITTPSGRIIKPSTGRCWFTSKENFEELINDSRIWFGKTGNNVPRIKTFLSEVKGGITPQTVWDYSEVGHNQDARQEIKELAEEDDNLFDTPKPEGLLERIFFLASNEGDLVLDIFGGSGTSFAVAHKMNRNWIGVEIGEHTDTSILPRLQKVIDGTDQGGVSKSVNWQGGGAFKYYHLGPSIITTAADGTHDLNWGLGAAFLQESLLSSYDYTPLPDTQEQLYESIGTLRPVVGIQQFGRQSRIGVVSLNAPDGSMPNIGYEEIRQLYDQLKKSHSPHSIAVFTNRGVDIAFESKPDDLEIIKVPHAIFAELEN
jgi:adenine-specific DNA-methyltransferase